MSYKKIVNKFKELAEAHPEVNLFGAGFEDQHEEYISKERDRVSIWVTEPTNGGVFNANQIIVDVIASDLLRDGRQNEIDLISDLGLILNDFKQSLEEGGDEFELVGFSYSNSRGNTGQDEEVEARASFTFNFVDLGTCNF